MRQMAKARPKTRKKRTTATRKQVDQSIATATNPTENIARFPYFGGLDGLRAIAVVGVLLYHAGLSFQGGFLGVETFFVLSGFLITALLIHERTQHGRIDLVSFWWRRVRRLVPALCLVLVCTFGLSVALGIERPSELGIDILAALGYVMNWHLIASQQSYFDASMRPPLLQHLWSLAIEEQFYLLWPIFFMVGMRYLRRFGLLIALLGTAAASLVLMMTLYQPGADPSRIYYGTDTRASGLLLGCAFALIWSPWRKAATHDRRTAVVLDVAGIVAFIVLLASYLWLYEAHPRLYRGGFTLVACCTIVVIAAVTHPCTRLLPRLLSVQPLHWIGLRSYSIYLWHWPILMVTRPYVDVPLDGWQLHVLRLALVLLIAQVSFRYVEEPIRRGALVPLWRFVQNIFGGPIRQLKTGAFVKRSLYSRPLWALSVMSLMLAVACATPPSPIVPNSQSSVAAGDALAAATATPITTTDTAALTSASAVVPTATTTAEPTATSSPTATTEPTATATATTPPATPTATTEPTTTIVALTPFDAELAAKLQRVLDATVADGAIPGVVLSVSVEGQEPWSGSSGIADRRTQRPMEPSTNVRIASISKIFTAVVVMQLAAENVVDLDAPIATYLPDLIPNGDVITVRNLLNHTSGLYDYLEDRNMVSRAYANPERIWQPAELVQYANQFESLFRPGSAGNWDYSSTNYVLLGMVVESATGNTLAQEMRQRIFEPLELTQTYFPPDEQVPATTARGYGRAVDQSNVSLSFAYATANVVSTADDVRRFVEGLVNGALLPPEQQEQMFTFVSGKGQYNMPTLEYGLGIMRNRLAVGPAADGQQRAPAASTAVGHIGGFGGFRSAVWSAPEGGITVALGVNQASTDPNILATRLFNTILTHQGR